MRTASSSAVTRASVGVARDEIGGELHRHLARRPLAGVVQAHARRTSAGRRRRARRRSAISTPSIGRSSSERPISSGLTSRRVGGDERLEVGRRSRRTCGSPCARTAAAERLLSARLRRVAAVRGDQVGDAHAIGQSGAHEPQAFGGGVVTTSAEGRVSACVTSSPRAARRAESDGRGRATSSIWMRSTGPLRSATAASGERDPGTPRGAAAPARLSDQVAPAGGRDGDDLARAEGR